MSRIEVTVAEATATIGAETETRSPAGITPHYSPRDLVNATAAALLAVNTPQAVDWAHQLYELTSGREVPRGGR